MNIKLAVVTLSIAILVLSGMSCNRDAKSTVQESSDSSTLSIPNSDPPVENTYEAAIDSNSPGLDATIQAASAQASMSQTPMVMTTVSAQIPIPQMFPLVIMDSDGNEIVFERPPERIVSIDSDSVEILFAMGEGDRLVATHDFVSYPPEADTIELVGTAFELNLEKIVELEPDLVYLFFDRFRPELEALGLRVLYINTLNGSIPGVMDHFRLWGRITGNPEASAYQISLFERRLADLQEKLKDVDKGPRVYHHTYEFWAPGSDTLIGEIYSLLEAELITADLSGYKQISQEVVVEKDPEVIVAGEFSIQEIKDNVALQSTTAVQLGRVVSPSRGSLSVAGPRLIDAIEELAEFLYPELFP